MATHFKRENAISIQAQIPPLHRYQGPFSEAGALRWQRSVAKVEVELLVDGDSHSLTEIRDGIEILHKDYGTVRTCVFAAPRRQDSKRWQQFFAEPDIVFRPVPRRSAQDGGEANDDAIIAETQSLAKSKTVGLLALILSDKGLVDVIGEVVSCGQPTIVLVPVAARNTGQLYEEIGAQVLHLARARPLGHKVRAVLHAGGEGSVEMADTYASQNNEKAVPAVCTALQDFGYFDVARSDFLLRAVVNFWVTNNMGSLTVFPKACATHAVYERLVQQPTELPLKKHQAELAYFLPLPSHVNPRQSVLTKFGSGKACQVFLGGGPFAWRDSKRLVSRALQRLGYLDSNLNSDFFEALLVFANRTDNKSPDAA